MTTLPVVIPKDFDKYFFNRKKDKHITYRFLTP